MKKINVKEIGKKVGKAAAYTAVVTIAFMMGVCFGAWGESDLILKQIIEKNECRLVGDDEETTDSTIEI